MCLDSSDSPEGLSTDPTQTWGLDTDLARPKRGVQTRISDFPYVVRSQTSPGTFPHSPGPLNTPTARTRTPVVETDLKRAETEDKTYYPVADRRPQSLTRTSHVSAEDLTSPRVPLFRPAVEPRLSDPSRGNVRETRDGTGGGTVEVLTGAPRGERSEKSHMSMRKETRRGTLVETESPGEDSHSPSQGSGPDSSGLRTVDRHC